MSNTIKPMGMEAGLLLAHMRDAAIGQEFTYEELSAVIGQPVAAAYGPLRTAVLRLLRDNGIVFGCVRSVGMKRLTDIEIVDSGAAAAESIRRKARRTIEKQLKADFSALPREKQMRFSAQMGVFAAVSMFSKPKSIEKLASAVPEGQRQLPVADTLRMFAKN